MTEEDLAEVSAERLAEMVREARKEAAGFRTRLRDTETERDALASTVSGFQQTALREAAAKAGLAKTAAGDLDAHLPLADVLGEDGLLDADKTDAALRGLRAERPHLFGAGNTVSGAESYGGAGDDAPQVSNWADVLRG